MKRLSTTARIATLVFLFQVAASALLVVALGAYVRWTIGQETAKSEAVLRDDLLDVYRRDGDSGLAREITDRTTRLVTPGALMLLADPKGAKLAGNLDHWPTRLRRASATEWLDLKRSDGLRTEGAFVHVGALPGGNLLLTGFAAAGEQRARQVVLEAALAACGLAFLFAAMTAWLSARLFAGRLTRVVHVLEAVGSGKLDRRVPPDQHRDAFAALGRDVNATLDRLARMIGQMRMATDALAHDLKSPVTRIVGSIERLRGEVKRIAPDDVAALDSANAAQRECHRLLTIVDTALSIRRAEAGIGRENFVPVDLADMVGSLAEIYGPVAEELNRTIEVDVQPDIAALSVHRELLAQALGNLIENALKYGAGPIALRLGEAARKIRISVADRGSGILAAERETALQRFGRLDSARGGEGAGLGLSLVMAVAQMHGGSLELADNAPGLVAVITIPR